MRSAFYVTKPGDLARLAERWSGAHALLSNKYYVDELYDATVVAARWPAAAASGASTAVVDGAVNGSGWLTVVAAWISAMFDEYVVDGAGEPGRLGDSQESSFVFRRLQTGLIQNYALLMLSACSSS